MERRFEQILERAGEPGFERQIDLGDSDGWIGRVDFLDRRARLVVEVQSDLFHAGLVDQDADRRCALGAAGWVVLEITEHEIWYRADVVVAKVRAARRHVRSPKLVQHVTAGVTY